MINEYLKKEIKKEAIKNIPNECCGLILNIEGELDVFPCQNISYHKHDQAILNPLDFVRASKKGKVVGHYHSHECSGTTFIDNLNAMGHNIYSIVYSWKVDRFYIISNEYSSYLNLDYKIGQNDCFELVRNYYKNELNIKISNYDRYDKWELDNPNLMLDNYKKEGFYKVDFNNIQENDVIIFNVLGYASHLGIWLNNGFILHHPENDKSVICEISPSLLRRINTVIRHKEFKNE